MLRRVAVSERHVPGDGDPAIAEHRLEEVLVHAESRRGDTGADVGNAGELEEPLNGPVFSERPVQDRQHDVDAAELARREPSRRPRASVLHVGASR